MKDAKPEKFKMERLLSLVGPSDVIFAIADKLEKTVYRDSSASGLAPLINILEGDDATVNAFKDKGVEVWEWREKWVLL